MLAVPQRRRARSSLLLNTPLLGIILIIYNGIAFYSDWLSMIIWPSVLPSGIMWYPTVSDIFVLIGIVVLYVEIFKSTRVSDVQIIEHLLSFLVFLIYLLEFLFVAPVGHSSFLFLCFMAGLDIVAGFTISISAGRRDISIGR